MPLTVNRKPPSAAVPPAGAKEFRNMLARAGISVADWARENGFAPMTVIDVLRGHVKGHRGEAHRVAVAIGLKSGDIVDVREFSTRLAAKRINAHP